MPATQLPPFPTPRPGWSGRSSRQHGQQPQEGERERGREQEGQLEAPCILHADISQTISQTGPCHFRLVFQL